MKTAMVVFMLPLAELLGELGRSPEDHTPIELVFIRPMTALDLPIDLGAASRNLAVDHPEVPQVPGEVGPEFGAVIGLDALDCHWQAAPHFFDEVRSRFDGVVRIDPEHPIAGGFVDGGELVEGTAAELEVLDIDLDRLPRNVNLAPAAGSGTIALQGHPGHSMAFQDPLDCRRRDINLVVALQEEADPEWPVLALPADLQDQSDDVGRCREGVMPGPRGPSRRPARPSRWYRARYT